jgi:hypothetical protein
MATSFELNPTAAVLAVGVVDACGLELSIGSL